MIAEIKAFDGAKWSNGQWTILDNPRNQYSLRILGGGTHGGYDMPIEPTQANRPIYGHQNAALGFLFTRRRAILAGEMGIGKTLVGIELMETLSGYWWIVAPKSALIAWEMEFRKWKFTGRPEISSSGGLQYRLMTYARFTKMVGITKVWPNHIIFDESHNLKTPTTLRTMAALEMSQLISGHIVCFTGTPSPRDPSDWWAQVEICQPGFLREASKSQLARRLGEFETMEVRGKQFSKLIKWKQDELRLLRKRLDGMVLSILKKDCLDLPDKIYIERQCEYTKATENLVLTLKNITGEGIKLLNRLRQFSDGFEYGSSGTVKRTFHTPKDDLLLEYLLDLERNRLVVYAAYHATIDKLVRMAQENKWDVIKLDGRGMYTSKRGLTIEQFQNRTNCIRPTVFIGHPQAGGQGLTLNASDTIIYYSNDFSAVARPQSEDRIHRIGTTKAVIVDFYWIPTDRYIRELLRDRRGIAAITTGEINEYLEQSRGTYYQAQG